jgi:hypothetical protein
MSLEDLPIIPIPAREHGRAGKVQEEPWESVVASMAPRVVLCIVGSQASAWKDPTTDRLRVEAIIRPAVRLLVPDLIISGRSPGGGVDVWAEEMASQLGYTEGDGFWPFEPTVRRWEGEGGYKQRDRAMAEACTHLLAIRSMWSKTYGSGWTADRARTLGKIVALEVI